MIVIEGFLRCTGAFVCCVGWDTLYFKHYMATDGLRFRCCEVRFHGGLFVLSPQTDVCWSAIRRFFLVHVYFVY